jgi:hypothetical protein
MRQKEFEYFLVGRFGLIGEKQVTRLVEQNEFCTWNPRRNKLSIAGRYQRIRLSMDD